MDNNLCCVINAEYSCTFCDFKICEPCHEASGDEFAHSHTIGLIADRDLPFFCPKVTKLLQSRRSLLVDVSKDYINFCIQINYLESIKGKDAPRQYARI